MPSRSLHDQILELERDILRAICCGSSTNREVLPAVIQDLSDYSWLGAEHRIVYGALMRVQLSGGEPIAAQLPAQATRMGFPDVEWELYLQAVEAERPDIPDLIGALKAAAAKESWRRE